MDQQLPIEWQLVFQLVDSLNAENVLGTVGNRMQWLGYTSSPGLYGVGVDYLEDDDGLVQKRADIVTSATALLEEVSSRQVRACFKAALKHTHYCVTHNSMAMYNQHSQPTVSTSQLFRVFALSNGIKLLPASYFKVEQEEKLELAELFERVPITSVCDPAAKTNVLLPAYYLSSNLKDSR
ncbi:hypothetical protein JVU11DRAFT_12860 [Chiua virens]|nr:hypothetical protein JVU11DRAFT_12860 [Chiua virens]